MTLKNKEMVMPIIVALFIFGQSAVTAFQVIRIWQREGTGDYTHIDWENSELIRWLQQHPVNGDVHSNAPDLIYLKTGVIAKPLPPHGTDIAAWYRILPTNVKHYGAWFGQSFRTYMVNPKELAEVLQLKLLLVTRNEAFFEIQGKVNHKR